MTLVMAYAVLVAASIGACTVVLESVARARGLAGRWVWVSALGLTLVATVLTMIVPRQHVEIPLAAVDGSAIAAASPNLSTGSPAPPSWETLVATADALLPGAWIFATMTLVIAIGIGRRRLQHERARSQATELAGHRVLLTEATGPAVAGIREPVVFVPRWVLALDEPSQRLLLMHEMEHVKRRDTAVLFSGVLFAAMLPWNPVVWWMVRRLRLSVEQDCDARVLATYPGVRRYADLLLTAASRHGLTSGLLAAHFGEHTSDLMRRIEAMTSKDRLSLRRVVSAGFVAAALIVTACETPRPEPVAPISSAGTNAATNRAAPEFEEFEVKKPVSLVQGSTVPRYPEILRQAGVEGEALVSFIVDEAGVADPSSFKVVRTTHELFATAVRAALPGMRFKPAELGGRKVKQRVEHPFTFTIVGGKGTTESPKPAYIVLRESNSAASAPNVTVFSSDGHEIARSAEGNDLLKKIDPRTIHSIEVWKPAACPPAETCPLIKITLAKGKTLRR